LLYLLFGEIASFPVPRAPDFGCQAIVVRTGFGTSQVNGFLFLFDYYFLTNAKGGLMRKILFATERINVNSRETFLFIGVLLIFAIISSAAALRGGLFDESRNQFKLVLHCIMIVTSVVPPELPMELSLAVTNSLQSLVQGLVYCTEPFRIPFAGRVSVLCFDKTGRVEYLCNDNSCFFDISSYFRQVHLLRTE
jgi:manganese-transporting P-type ATPase